MSRKPKTNPLEKADEAFEKDFQDFVAAEIARKKREGKSVTFMDPESRKVYKELPNGERVYVK